MQKINCLIIEDEPLAAEIIQDYVGQIHFLKLIDVCSDAIYALEILQKLKIDLIFLDIHLPKLKGIEFIKSLQHPPAIIITSAYQDYALAGYELNVLDYLLKPVAFDRFLSAINKVRPLNISQSTHEYSPGKNDRPFSFFNVGRKRVKIYFDEILFIESLKEYVRVVAADKSIVTKLQFGQSDDLLANRNFMRIHRSFIIAKDKVDAFTATEVEIGGRLIPIGRSYKEQVVQQLEG